MEDDFVLSGPTDDLFIPKNKTLGQYFFESLRERNKDDEFSRDGLTNEVLTCGVLLEKAVKLVNILKKHGISQGDVITLSSENRLEYAIPLLAAFSMGVTVNILNCHYSVGEVTRALNIAKPKLIICTKNTVENLAEAAKCVDSVKSILLTCSDTEEYLKSNVTNLQVLYDNTVVDCDYYKPDYFDSEETDALIALSSGTTGLPKGVRVTHEALKSSICSLCDYRYGGCCGNQVVLALLPFSFLYGACVLFTAFVQPIKLIVLNKFEPKTFLEAIDRCKITKLLITPSVVLFLASSPLVENYDLSSLEDVISAGSCLGNDVAKEASEAIGGVEIRQGYGSTELGVCTLTQQHSNKVGSVGTLVKNVKGKVVNCKTGNAVGPFEFGEICFKPSTALKGYMNNEGTHDVDEQGFFHTADIGYYDDEGNFFITGRFKEIIKYKGFQVSPYELEELLLQHSGIKDCGVVGIPNERAGELPFAFVVPKNSVSLKESDVVKYVAEKISIQKQLHGGVAFINEIPRNSSGKIVRKQLLEIYKNMK